MSRLIGTVGYYNHDTGRGFIHPDTEYLEHGINVLVTPEGLGEGGPDSLRSGQRITCVVNQGQEGKQAFDIKQYGGQGRNAD
jgi:cold shock CspA family protein